MLDTAMHELSEPDREVILLRYFQNQPYAEIGVQMGVSENTARMRAERAVEKLRATLSRHGVAATTTLSAALSAHAVDAAPPDWRPPLPRRHSWPAHRPRAPPLSPPQPSL